MRLVCPEFLWRDGALHQGQAVEIEHETVTQVRDVRADDMPELRPHILMPACTDLQVNGAGGVMLNSEPTVAGIAQIVETQTRLGTAWVMPTLITTTTEVMNAACDAMIAAWGMRGLLGMHIEGPHLNVIRKGTHNAELIRPFEDSTLDILRCLRNAGIPVMLTLAPELVADHVITELADMGVVVFAGHTMADFDETNAALNAGLRGFTHLFNAMPQMTSRESGIIAAALASDGYAGIIADGHHVAWEMIALACRARPTPGRMFLVSDAMSTIGGPDHFMLYGEKISVKDGALVNAKGSLAGAHIDMVTSLRNMILHVGITPQDAIAMATDIPNVAMRLPTKKIETGRAVQECLALDAGYKRIALDVEQ
ncbi:MULTISPECIES: N-acetylglucosamine-6-phosphate deacetylase [Rhodobacterales]|uniref:N-acetylglucosamine-6-phosphate deacetylase n=1 Tax=Rhodobacterales TaxID=204455 RepID=UPI001C68D68B|nr:MULTISPECIES: N-acetylglucosamine-6-phosphate deacetylase [Rhodobacterales]MDO6591904.1 N-acetylglucosamine-6-phosphate deacetylase [Yoonia sp. 1_MG-2023]